MSYGSFKENGKFYEITTTKLPKPWTNILFNKEYIAITDELLQGSSQYTYEYGARNVTTGFRQFYIHDHTKNKNYHLNSRENNKNYRCRFYAGKTVLLNNSDGIESEISIFLPVKGNNEYWKATIKNTNKENRTVSLFSATGFSANGSPMGGRCTYKNGVIYEYAFPYHVYYEDKEKAEKEIGYFYLVSDVLPNSTDMSVYRFWGNYYKGGMPVAVENGKCSGLDGEVEDFAAVMEHKFELKPNEEKTVYFGIGYGIEEKEMFNFKKKFTTKYAESVLNETDTYFDNLFARNRVETPDAEFNAFVNTWMKKQSMENTYSEIRCNVAPMRNRLQYALGYSINNPEDAKWFMYEVVKRQKKSGFIQQWYPVLGTANGGLCLLNHCDGPEWLVICLSYLINECGDIKMLDDIIPYYDGGEGTLLEHLFKAIKFEHKDVGEHGLSLMHDGDWTDPMNGIGRLNKGESTWNTLAAIYGMDLFIELLTAYGDETKIKTVKSYRNAFEKAVNTYAWDEKAGYYYGGWHDDGKPFGYSGDGIIVLNSQSFAVLTGVAQGDRLARTRKAIDKITTTFGPFVNYPPFMKYDPRWGRISLKRPGTTENGCVYSHATMFKAAGDAMAKDGDAVFKTLYEISPISKKNPTEVNRQLPTFVPNYYYSLEGSPNFGVSSNGYCTGTAAWFNMVLIEKLFGMRSTVRGIVLEPCMPKSWDNVSATRTFKKATYNITYSKKQKGITVDGKKIDTNILPYKAGKVYTVVCGI